MTDSASTLFISDLHLAAHSETLCQHFYYFMNEIAPTAKNLYILGDFFEFWLGRDIKDNAFEKILTHLQNLAQQGTQIYFMRGNRDFLLTEPDISAMNMTFINDPTLIKLHGKNFLLTHGDRLCTLDIAYIRYRRIANLKLFQWLFLHSPKALRQKMADRIHAQNPHKYEAQDLDYIKADATNAAVIKDIQRYQPDYIIHGHTHRMGLHWLNHTTRIVLGDWKRDYFNYLSVSSEQVLLKSCRQP